LVISENAHRQVDTDGSVVFLEMGEKRTVEELLIGIAVGSGTMLVGPGGTDSWQ